MKPGRRAWFEWLALLSFLSALMAVGAAQTPAEQVAPGTAGYAVPRTSWGDPDLTGIWPSIDMVRVPVRCISRGALGSTLPVLYNSGIDITQAPGYVALRYEMVHDYRVIPLDGRPRLSSSIRQHMGDARGRWEGDTLVVETTNFTDRVGVGLSGGGVPNSTGMRLVERFTRVSNDTIRYEATVHDPQTWTMSWTVAFPLTRMADYGMYEYACHEGNLGLRYALSGSRAGERVSQPNHGTNRLQTFGSSRC